MPYKRTICKSDQDPSSMALNEAVKRECHEGMITDDSPVGEHQANGRVDRVIQ